MSVKKSNPGFSMVEILTVLALISILGSYAYPNYQAHILRAHRTEAQAALVMLASQLETYYAEHHTYEDANIEQLNGSNKTQNGYYILSIADLSPTTYTVLATPQGNQLKDRLCQTLTFNQLGHKGIQEGPGGSPSGTASQCWE
jgi:type IV pilus assembly protein PilE